MPNMDQYNDLGQPEIDRRGLVTQSFAEKVRATRAAEQWERYDSIVIGGLDANGNGPRNLDDGWFNSWNQFSQATRFTFFSRRQEQVGFAFTNQPTERTDWAQDLFQMGVEFHAPVGMGDLESDANDETTVPMLFVNDLPNKSSFRVRLADADEIVMAPGSHFPSGYGVVDSFSSAAAAPTTYGGHQGNAHVSNTWKWPEPIMLAAQAKITVIGEVDNPLRDLLEGLPGPGSKLIPDGAGGQIQYPNWYIIRVFLRGPRYLQLRGARSAAG